MIVCQDILDCNQVSLKLGFRLLLLLLLAVRMLLEREVRAAL